MTLLVAWLLAAPVQAETLATHTVTVRAADRAYPAAPLVATLPVPAGDVRGAVLVPEAGGDAVPGQVETAEGRLRVTWIEPPLQPGDERTYRLELTDGAAATPDAVALSEVEGAVEVRLDGELFTRYCYAGGPFPYCYPIIGPTGGPVTRAWPMEEQPGEARDHAHHRSWWFTHGDVNGVDFWTSGEGQGREVHEALEAVVSGPVMGVLRARNNWVAPDGVRVCEEVREYRFYRLPDCRLADLTVTLTASDGPVVFGDTKEGTMGLRVAETMRVDAGTGHIMNANGQRDGEAWGKSAPWCDCYGPVEGETVGIAVFDHPESLRHPTYWHVRIYGLFAANPFGVRAFTGDEGQDGRYELAAGASITFRYRVYIHWGGTEAADVAGAYAAFAGPPEVTVR